MNKEEAEAVERHWNEKLTKKYTEWMRNPHEYFDIITVGHEGHCEVLIFEDFTKMRRIKVAPKYARVELNFKNDKVKK